MPYHDGHSQPSLDVPMPKSMSPVLMHLQGDGVPIDYVAARMWFLRAAEQGHAVARYNLGSHGALPLRIS